MKIMITDEYIEKVAKEYERTVDHDILVYIEQDKLEYKKLLNAAISCGVKTFEQFYEEHLKQFDRLN